MSDLGKPTPKGATIRWLQEHIAYQGDECLKWPFCTINGYGQFGFEGRQLYAHRYMCELTHGPAPTAKHYATHSCGNGHLGCVNPRHLRWLTPSENQTERRDHGSHNVWGQRGKLTHEERLRIRDLNGTMPQREIAELLGISRAAVSKIVTRQAWLKQKGIKRQGNRWIAYSKINGHSTYLGCFKTEEAARAAYTAGAVQDLILKGRTPIPSADRSGE